MRLSPSVRLAALESGAAVLRRAGLGRIVSMVARHLDTRLGRFEIDINGVRLGGRRVGHLYYARAVAERQRERFFRELFVASIPPAGTVLEGGPYIGYLTLLAATSVGPRGHVVVVEPDPETLVTLRENLARNQVADRVRVVEAALGAAPGRATFHVTDGGDTSSLHDPGVPSRRIEVSVVPGDDVLERADVIKLDVEGNEVAAVAGLRKLIERCRPTIFCECNPEMLATAGSSPPDLYDALHALGYDIRWIDEDARALRPLHEPWTEEYVNLCCTPHRDLAAEA